MTLPGLEEPSRDPDLAARLMGHDNVTVLPAPLLGHFARWDKTVVELNADLPEDATPVLLQEMVKRLQTFADVITWTVLQGSRVSEILLELEFVSEAHWDRTLRNYRPLLVWRR